MEPVYHFTDTIRLPWILSSDQIKASRGTVGNYPARDFLWGTIDERGSPTAAMMNALSHYKNGIINIVRFTLRGEDFEPYLDVLNRYPEWQPHHIDFLRSVAKDRGENPDNWRARETGLGRDRWVALHMRSYTRPAWVPLALDTPVLTRGPNEKGIDFGGQQVIYSTQTRNEQDTVAYSVRRR